MHPKIRFQSTTVFGSFGEFFLGRDPKIESTSFSPKFSSRLDLVHFGGLKECADEMSGGCRWAGGILPAQGGNAASKGRV